MVGDGGDTRSAAYSERLARLSGVSWKRLLNVQAPYRWNLRRLLGDRPTLDVGCGIGRNLAALSPASVGVDHNETSVRACTAAGLTAMTPAEFLAEPPEVRGRFDGLLGAHLVEHLPAGAAVDVLRPYLAYLSPQARVVLICPQERGYASDPTHTVFTDNARLRELCGELGLSVDRQFSFPFPRGAGRVFTYNEFVTVAGTP